MQERSSFPRRRLNDRAVLSVRDSETEFSNDLARANVTVLTLSKNKSAEAPSLSSQSDSSR